VKRVIVRPAAAADIDDAYRWYEQQRAGLGEEFLAVLRTTMDRVVAQSEAFAVIHRATRRALVPRRFPYGLFYRVHGDTIVVVACMHAKRDPRQWQRRS
jgi:plasmid stabilization system protein ParE